VARKATSRATTKASSVATVPLSPTTGEPMSTVARRSIGALWAFIVMDVSGTLALVISYSYLWALNVNDAWAPPGAKLEAAQTDESLPKASDVTFAPEWPFWAIFSGVVLVCLLSWLGYRRLIRGHTSEAITAGTFALLLSGGLLVAQVVQIISFKFTPTQGAYASVVYALTASNVLHLLIVCFLLIGVVNRTRMGLISPVVAYQSRMMSIWLTWIAIAFLLGAVCTSVMVESPNTDPAVFGTFETT
jgi:heme/copper-type cytochrome/quinol oxidase subunit 3